MVIEYIIQQCSWVDFTVKSVVSATKEDLNASDYVLLAAPTYDHWILHTPYERFLDKVNVVDLSRQYVVIGLGDDKYDKHYNVEAAPILEEFVVSHWWTLLCKSLQINKNPITQLDSHVKNRVDTIFLPAIKTS